MAELTLRVVPATGGKFAKPIQRDVQERVEVPSPKPVVLQILALVVLLAVTGVLALLLLDDPSVVAAAFMGAGLVMCVFALILWASSVLGLGIGPAQLLALVRTVARAIKDATSKPATPTPPTNPSAGAGGDTPAGA